MKRWLPFPLLFCCLLAMWMLLNQTLSLDHVLLGAIIAFGGTWIMTALRSPGGGLRRPVAIARLCLIVFVDIVRFNAAVAAIILGARHHERVSGFLDMPLVLNNPYGLAALACIITATPGTCWVGFDSTNGILTVHVLDLVDEQPWIDLIKGSYERQLLEIFE